LIAEPTLAAALFSMHFLRISGASSSPVLVNRKGESATRSRPSPDGLRKLPGLQISLFAPSGKWMTLPSIVTVLPPS
jgi:hypothetical protein